MKGDEEKTEDNGMKGDEDKIKDKNIKRDEDKKSKTIKGDSMKKGDKIKIKGQGYKPKKKFQAEKGQ